MTLADVVAELERGLEVCGKVGFVGDWSRAPEGSPYVVLTHAGVKREGAPHERYGRTEAEAIEMFAVAAKNYRIAAKGRFICWRQRPTVERASGWRGVSRYIVWSRLVITDHSPFTVSA